MKINIKYLFFIILLIIIIHSLAIFLGLYNTKPVVIDIPQHFLAGIFFSLFFLMILEKKSIDYLKSSRLILFISLLGVSLLGSFLWELLELILLNFFTKVAYELYTYSSTVSDSLTDMYAGVLGGLATYLYIIKKQKALKTT